MHGQYFGQFLPAETLIGCAAYRCVDLWPLVRQQQQQVVQDGLTEQRKALTWDMFLGGAQEPPARSH
jgi:hypothetical protein